MARSYRQTVDTQAMAGDARSALWLTPAGEALTDAVGAFVLAAGLHILLLCGGMILWFASSQVIDAVPDLQIWWLVLLTGLVAWLPSVWYATRKMRAWWLDRLETAAGLDLNQDDSIGVQSPQRERIRPIPVHRSDTPLVGGVDAQDLAVFIKRIDATRDWTVRTWRNARLPSGRRCDDEYHRQLVSLLESAGYIEGRGPRTSGQLVASADQMLAAFGLRNAIAAE